MNHLPQDTRNMYKKTRDSFNAPQMIPNTFNPSFGELTHQHSPNYDRNMFSNPQNSVEMPPRNMMNDRLFETSQLYRNFGNTNIDYHQSIGSTKPVYYQTRERRDEKPITEEQRNMDRLFMNTRDYNAEVNERMNGFNLVARDTRFESSKKSSDSNGNMEMRSNRYLGMPGNNI